MDKTLQVNIGGRLFTIEQDAYDRLYRYLKHYEASLHLPPDEVRETMEDFEMRIAELLLQHIFDIKRPVQLAQIEKVIETLGSESEMGDTTSSSDYAEGSGTGNYAKRLYRDPDHAILGGVCGGLGAYLDIDPVWVRLAFVLFLFFTGISLLLYIILWIVLTPANTIRQQNELKGQPIDFGRIRTNMNQEFSRVRDQFSNYRNNPQYQHATSGFERLLRGIGMVIAAFFKVMLSFAGIIFIVAGVILLIGLTFGWLNVFHGPMFSMRMPHWWNIEIMQTHGFLFGLCLLILIALPIVGLFTALIRWLSNSPRRNQNWQVFSITLWSLALAGIITLAVVNRSSWEMHRTVRNTYQLNEYDHHKTLYIKLKDIDVPDDELHYYTIFNKEFTWNKHRDELLQTPKIDVQHHNSDQIKLVINKKYYTFQDKRQLEGRLFRTFHWDLENNTLWLDPCFEVDGDELWHWPRMDITVYIPRNQDYVIDSSVAVLMSSHN